MLRYSSLVDTIKVNFILLGCFVPSAWKILHEAWHTPLNQLLNVYWGNQYLTRSQIPFILINSKSIIFISHYNFQHTWDLHDFWSMSEEDLKMGLFLNNCFDLMVPSPVVHQCLTATQVIPRECMKSKQQKQTSLPWLSEAWTWTCHPSFLWKGTVDVILPLLREQLSAGVLYRYWKGSSVKRKSGSSCNTCFCYTSKENAKLDGLPIASVGLDRLLKWD